MEKIDTKSKAYTSLRGQRSRCNNPKASDYKYYGGRGIEALCDTREFLEWWEKEAKKLPNDTKLSIDRLDHNGNYTMNNIQLISLSDNVREANTRRASLYEVFNKEGISLGVDKGKVIKAKYNLAGSTLSHLAKTQKFSLKHNILIKRR